MDRIAQLRELSRIMQVRAANASRGARPRLMRELHHIDMVILRAEHPEDEGTDHGEPQI